MTRVIGNFLFIPQNEFSVGLAEKLTIDNPFYKKKQQMGIALGDEPKRYFLYEEFTTPKGMEYVRLPRYSLGDVSMWKTYLDTRNNITTELAWNKKAINPDGHRVLLNWSQAKTIKNTVAMLNREYGGTIVAETGEGKTTMAIYLMSCIKQKTLILCHKESLTEQWYQALLHLTHLEKKDIGYLKRGKFKNAKVVLGSQQSLMSETFDNSINDEFGLVIQDEVHLIGAQMFLKSFARFNPTYRLGLSATPNREDGLEQIYLQHLGSSKVYHKSVRTVPAKVKFYDYGRIDNWKWYPPFIPEKTALINNVVSDTRRNEEIEHIVHDLIYVADRKKIIVFSERVKHLKDLMKLISNKNPTLKTIRFFGEEKETRKIKKWVFTFKKNQIIEIDRVGHIKINGFNQKKDLVKYTWLDWEVAIGDEIDEVSIEYLLENPDHHLRRYIAKRMVKQTVTLDEYNEPSRDKLLASDVIFATYSKAKDGLDIPPLDTVIFSTPFGSTTTLEQCIGRPKRQYKGKEFALVVDINDVNRNISEKLYWKRYHTYRNLNVEILSKT